MKAWRSELAAMAAQGNTDKNKHAPPALKDTKGCKVEARNAFARLFAPNASAEHKVAVAALRNAVLTDPEFSKCSIATPALKEYDERPVAATQREGHAGATSDSEAPMLTPTAPISKEDHIAALRRKCSAAVRRRCKESSLPTDPEFMPVVQAVIMDQETICSALRSHCDNSSDTKLVEATPTVGAGHDVSIAPSQSSTCDGKALSTEAPHTVTGPASPTNCNVDSRLTPPESTLVATDSKAHEEVALPIKRDDNSLLTEAQVDDMIEAAKEHHRAEVNDMISAVKEDWNVLRRASARLRANREVVLAAVHESGKAIRHAADALWSDREIVMTAIETNPKILAQLPYELASDSELVMSAVRRDGLLLKHATEEMRADPDFVEAAVLQNGLALRYAAEELIADYNLASIAIGKHPLALEFVGEDLQDDPEMVLSAVSKNGLSLQHASTRLQGDFDIVSAAVRKNGKAIQYASDDLQLNKDIVLEAVSERSSAIDVLRDEFLQDPDVLQLCNGKRRRTCGGNIDW